MPPIIFILDPISEHRGSLGDRYGVCIMQIKAACSIQFRGAIRRTHTDHTDEFVNLVLQLVDEDITITFKVRRSDLYVFGYRRGYDEPTDDPTDDPTNVNPWLHCLGAQQYFEESDCANISYSYGTADFDDRERIGPQALIAAVRNLWYDNGDRKDRKFAFMTVVITLIEASRFGTMQRSMLWNLQNPLAPDREFTQVQKKKFKGWKGISKIVQRHLEGRTFPPYIQPFLSVSPVLVELTMSEALLDLTIVKYQSGL